MSDALQNKHRPKKFTDVVGQGPIVKSLSGIIKRGGQQTFLFTGPSGCGKTTLARIAARRSGCSPENIREIDAATYTSVDDMRNVLQMLQYEAFGESSNRALIIDEAHRLSRQAWDSLLKATEEPPKGVFWFLCTTEPAKVPKTIQTRCAAFTLKPVGVDDLCELFDRVADAEGLEYEEAVIDLILEHAFGSPRQLLVNMELCRDVKSKKDAEVLLQAASGSAQVRDLCQFLLRPQGGWSKAMAIVNKLEDEAPENVRMAIVGYMTAVAKNAKSEKSATQAVMVLIALKDPWYNPSEKWAPLIRALGEILLT